MITFIRQCWLNRNTRYMVIYESHQIYMTGYFAVCWHGFWFKYLGHEGTFYFMPMQPDMFGVS